MAPPRGTADTLWQLRPVRDDAAEAAAILDAFASAPDMARQGDVTDAESARTYLAWLTGKGQVSTALVDGEDRMVGLVGLVVDEQNRTGWMHYWLRAEHRGAGLMARAAATVANRALRPGEEGGFGLERLELGHRVNNPASGAVARAAGFVHEGTERAKFLIDGERIDVLTYGRLREDPVPETAELPWQTGSGAPLP